MSQVQNITKYDETSIQSNESNRFSTCEEIVEQLVEQGLPKTFSPVNFINKIAKAYNINSQEARTCLKLAIKQLEASKSDENNQKEEKLYGQSGYFYPSGYTTEISGKKDGMDSLSSLGNYNKLMFGLR